ncbi:MAG: mandelate racemase/muconate lactonizing enzyme family protein [Dehalococcoidia bacterium]
MKIADISTVVVDAERGRTWLFVEVMTDTGEVGVGEASQSRFDAGVEMLVQQVKPLIVGQHPMDLIEPLRARFLHNPFADRTRYSAFSGIEQALWDLAGKSVNEPVRRLFGGAHSERLRLYANINAAQNGNSPDELARVAALPVAEGFTAIKMYPFAPERGTVAGRPLSSAEMNLAVSRVAAVRAAIGPDVDLLTDWAWALTPADAMQMADRLTEFNLWWIEEPYVVADARALAELRNRIRTRLAGGEQLQGAYAFRSLFEARALDVIMPDVKWIGGMSEMRSVCATAATYDIEVAPHNMSGPVSTAAAAQVASTLRNFGILEYCWGSVPWRSELVRGTERIEDGHLVLSDAPGLGIDWDTATARRHPVG